MEIRLADSKDKQKIIKYDNHIHHNKVGECIWNPEWVRQFYKLRLKENL